MLDGPAATAWFAQTSGLAPDGDRMWLADSETSSLRRIEAPAPDGGPAVVHTAVGTGLFDFGFRDGPAAEALLQHPLGVAVLPDGSVAVADTYNGAVRRFADGELTTLAVDLAEPSNSAVLNAINGTLPGHPMTFPAGDPNLVTLEGYIQTASDIWKADGGGGTAPPGASPYDYAVFQAAIQPILDTAAGRGCALSGCHAAPGQAGA